MMGHSALPPVPPCFLAKASSLWFTEEGTEKGKARERERKARGQVCQILKAGEKLSNFYEKSKVN